MPEKRKAPQAVALKYDGTKAAAPVVTAKGRGVIAEKIIELAKKNDIPIKNDPALVELLSNVDLDEHIPLELYRAVAEILAFVYAVNDKKRAAKLG